MQLRALALALATCLIEAGAFKVPLFTVQDVLDPSADTYTQLQHAISKFGIIAIESEKHTSVLQELTKCIHSGSAGEYAQDKLMKDQTLRTTLATSTNYTRHAPFAEGLQNHCPGFVKAAENLRSAAAVTGYAYARFLDRLGREGPLVDTTPGPFLDAISHSESLEHFHLFRRQEPIPADAEPTLHMHTDLGLFIVMTPPNYFELATAAAPAEAPATGFRLQLPDGSVVTPEFPPNSLLVMNGEGALRWVHTPVGIDLHVPPHEVILPEMSGMGRAWYGRMYLPAPTAKKDAQGPTFQQYWMEASQAVVRPPTGEVLVQEAQHRDLLVDQGTCSSGFLYCWMACRSTANLTSCSNNDIVCTDTNGKSWPADYTNATTGQATHCFDCTLKCNSTSSSSSSSTSAAVPTSPVPWLTALLATAMLLLLR